MFTVTCPGGLAAAKFVSKPRSLQVQGGGVFGFQGGGGQVHYQRNVMGMLGNYQWTFFCAGFWLTFPSVLKHFLGLTSACRQCHTGLSCIACNSECAAQQLNAAPISGLIRTSGSKYRDQCRWSLQPCTRLRLVATSSTSWRDCPCASGKVLGALAQGRRFFMTKFR